MKKRAAVFFLAICCSLLMAFQSSATDRQVIFVSIVPQKYFVEQLGKDFFDVEVMVKPGANPATYEPKPSQMAKLSKSSLYFAIGVPFEKAWLGRISAVNSDMKIVFTDRDIDKIAMIEHHHGDDGKGDDKQYHHGILDPHIWLSPTLVKKQIAVMLAALKNIAPEQSAFFDNNYREFIEKIEVLDTQLKAVFDGKQGLQFMVFHPSWGYFAREYGLKQVAVEAEGKTPKFAQLQELIHHARENDIHILFVQPQFSTKKAKIIAREINGEVVTADPLSGEWFENLRDVAERIQQALR